jgi:Family of unknown function (DUF6932)
VSAGHARGCAERIALDQTGNHFDLFFNAQFIHVHIMLDRSSKVKYFICIMTTGFANCLTLMPIPNLTNKGLLPIGVFDCTLAEIEARYSTVNHRPQRENLWNLFNEYLAVIRPLGIVQAIYVDGGFVTDKTMPKDIDLVLELPPPSPAFRAVLMNPAFNHDTVEVQYKMDIWLWHPAAVADDDWVAWFQEIKPKDLVRLHLKPDARKGILRVAL